MSIIDWARWHHIQLSFYTEHVHTPTTPTECPAALTLQAAVWGIRLTWPHANYQKQQGILIWWVNRFQQGLHHGMHTVGHVFAWQHYLTQLSVFHSLVTLMSFDASACLNTRPQWPAWAQPLDLMTLHESAFGVPNNECFFLQILRGTGAVTTTLFTFASELNHFCLKRLVHNSSHRVTFKDAPRSLSDASNSNILVLQPASHFFCYSTHPHHSTLSQIPMVPHTRFVHLHSRRICPVDDCTQQELQTSLSCSHAPCQRNSALH